MTIPDFMRFSGGSIPSDHDQRRYESIDQSQMDEILRSPVSWYPSLSDDPWSQLAYETTDIGEGLRNDYRAREGS